MELEQPLAGKAKLLFPVVINGALNLSGEMCFTLGSLPRNRAAGSFYFKLIEETSAHSFTLFSENYLAGLDVRAETMG